MATVTAVTNHFITAKEGFSTTLASSISSGATTVPLNSTAGYTDGDVVALTIEPASATAKQVFTGIKSGTSIINVVWTEGTNQAHAAGVTVIDYTTATHQAALVKGLLVGNNQNGTRKAFTESSIVPTAAIQDSAVVTAKIADSNVTAAKLATNAITLGYAQITSNFGTTSSSPTQITNLTSAVTIPAGGRRVKITVFVAKVGNTISPSNNTIAIWDGTVGSGTQLAMQQFTTSGVNYGGGQTIIAVVTPAAGAKTYNASLTNVGGGTSTIEAAATYPAFILVEAI